MEMIRLISVLFCLVAVGCEARNNEFIQSSIPGARQLCIAKVLLPAVEKKGVGFGSRVTGISIQIKEKNKTIAILRYTGAPIENERYLESGDFKAIYDKNAKFLAMCRESSLSNTCFASYQIDGLPLTIQYQDNSGYNLDYIESKINMEVSKDYIQACDTNSKK